ncbi:olfactory receptor 5G3-like [Pelobates fuscus]|uniref:olfactory receptor 5G3-like n=1 Tax=Pelobates fuscus TaxID=191477 RepID=UPI002FE47636
MDLKNQTVVTEFWFVGFQNVPYLKIPLFILFLVIYISILSGNLLIILLVSVGHNLSSPMYYFLANLSLSDIIFTTMIIPNILSMLLKQRERITFMGCITQLHFFGSSVVSQSFILTVMSYDRYLAISNPLRYITIMNGKLCIQLVTGSWLLACLFTMSIAIQLSQLQFCGNNVIDHFFCDTVPLTKLSCSDISSIKLQELILGGPVTFFPMAFVVGTYVCIFITILKISTTTGRQKAFFTCSSHLTVVCIYYGTQIALYMVPENNGLNNVTKVQTLLYITLTPLLNPIIYSLRNNEMRVAFTKLFGVGQKW